MPGGVRSLGPDVPAIEVVLEGSLSDPATMQLLLDGLRLMRREGVAFCIVDAERLTQKASPTTVIAGADRLLASDPPPGWRQAVLRPQDLDAAMATDLWEAAANNRGMLVKVFRDRDEALRWLLAD